MEYLDYVLKLGVMTGEYKVGQSQMQITNGNSNTSCFSSEWT